MNINELEKFNSIKFDGLKFCTEVYSLFETIRSSPNGTTRLRMKESKLEKKLLEELMPICKFVQFKYRAGRYISVTWYEGNQQFDAQIIQHGSYIDQGYYPGRSFLEVTCALSPNEYLERERIEKVGFAYGLDGLSRNKNREIESKPTVIKNREFIKHDAEYIISSIEKKAEINYPDNTILVVQSSLSTIYGLDEWQMLIENVTAGLPSNRFIEIFIYDLMHEYHHSFYQTNRA